MIVYFVYVFKGTGCFILFLQKNINKTGYFITILQRNVDFEFQNRIKIVLLTMFF